MYGEDDHDVPGFAARLRDTVDDVLAKTLGDPQPVALVNFPNHGNPGDSAIWLGTLRTLDRLGYPVRYQSSFRSFDVRSMRRAVPDGPVLINGGGNFGDLYAGQQGLREQLLRDLRGRRIVQLPQSIHFTDRRNIDRMARLIADHGDVTVLAREQRSSEFATRHFDAEVVDCPDMAFGLGSLTRIEDPIVDVAWIVRTDLERRDHGPRPPHPPGVRMEDVDWTGTVSTDEAAWTGRSRTMLQRNRRLNSASERHDLVDRWAWRALARTFEPLATAWLDRGVRLLGRGRVVVTDRLHGHILCVLLGVPHVVLDNSTGKVRSTFETWTHPAWGVVFADSAERAASVAFELVGTGPACSS